MSKRVIGDGVALANVFHGPDARLGDDDWVVFTPENSVEIEIEMPEERHARASSFT